MGVPASARRAKRDSSIARNIYFYEHGGADLLLARSGGETVGRIMANCRFAGTACRPIAPRTLGTIFVKRFIKPRQLWKKCAPSPIRSPCISLSRGVNTGTCRDTKSGNGARRSWQAACSLGFRGSLGEWERLMGAMTKR
jgi:hypothetical protein